MVIIERLPGAFFYAFGYKIRSIRFPRGSEGEGRQNRDKQVPACRIFARGNTLKRGDPERALGILNKSERPILSSMTFAFVNMSFLLINFYYI